MKLTAILLATVLVCVAGLIYAQQRQVDILAYVNQMRSDNIADREAAARAILQHKQQAQSRPDVISGIEKIVRDFAADDERKGTVKTAVALLGELQSVNSVPLLVEHLTFKVFYKQTKRPQPKEDLFPSVGALIKIGQPSLDPVLIKAGESDDEETARCAAFVVEGILKDGAATFLQERVARETNPIAQQRLLRLQQYLNHQ